jgi:hypothetical protein
MTSLPFSVFADSKRSSPGIKTNAADIELSRVLILTEEDAAHGASWDHKNNLKPKAKQQQETR